MVIKVTYCLINFLLILIVNAQNTPSPSLVIEKMLKAIDEIQTFSAHLKNTEKIDGILLSGSQIVQFVKKPFKCHLHFINPNNGSEVLYIEGVNDGNAVYYPNGFPYINLNLDPEGYLMRKNNHHTIFQLGFVYFSFMIKNLYTYKNVLIKLEKDSLWNNTPCHVISLEVSDYQLTSMVTSTKTTLKEIAAKHFFNEYKLMELNKDIGINSEIDIGTNVMIPNYFAKSVLILVDKNNYLPVVQIILDENGLFEKYEFVSLKVNKPIHENFFNEEFLGKHLY